MRPGPRRPGSGWPRRPSRSRWPATSTNGLSCGAERAAKSELRHRELGWLRAEAGAWSAVFDSGTPPERERALSVIRWWTRDTDLATVRGDEALAKLREAERKEWETFWKDYDALMRKGGEMKPR
jgi:hypothetical protein